MQEVDRVSGLIVDCAVRLHRRLGPGLFESVYELILAGRLRQEGLKVERQKSIDIYFEEQFYRDAFRIDLLVNDLVIVELKSSEKVAPAHLKQVLTYLRLTNLQVGLLINFGAPTVREGLHRVVNGYVPLSSARLPVR